MKFSLFNNKKDKKEEKGHREPIMVRIFKEGTNDSLTTVTFTSDDEPQVNGATDYGSASDTDSDAIKKVKFVPNQNYFTISIYVLGVLCTTILIGVLIFNATFVANWITGLLSVLSPFLAAAVIAFIVAPIVNSLDEGLFEKILRIKNGKVRMTLSVIIAYAVLIGLLALAVVVLVPQIGESISDLVSRSKILYDVIYEFLATLSERFPNIDFTSISDKLNDIIPNIVTTVTSWISNSIPKVLSTSYAIVKALINFLLTIAISIYMVCDKRRIASASARITYAFLKPAKAANFIKTSKECGQIFFGFIIGKAIDSLIIGLLCFIVVSIFKLPYAVLISVLVGVTNMIPFFGPFIGAIPGVLLYLCIEPVYALFFVIIVLVIQQLDGWVIGPMILGDSTGIRPIWVIFGITVGGAYFGVLGMFLGVPFTAVIVFLIKKGIAKRLEKKNIEVS